ncbi:ATP-binding protein [Sphingosinicella sp. CPCC 101087]|uniref:sensor histidine kinase n=1 Tax=Sphingosinicella sp. CPCC 101087 TaxID=2497754 RepID=UPI0013EB62ED|nr:ATP-binding protein [Sphingosinicella sp. CPCC 101087]
MSSKTELETCDGACWALDISGVRALIAAIASGAGPCDWVRRLLTGTLIADVNQRTVHLVGPYDGRDCMIGRPVAAFWPAEAREALAELIMAAVANHPAGSPTRREITSLIFSDPVLSAWTPVDGSRSDVVFLSVTGAPTDERSLWTLCASDERYRSLIHYLPIALLQVDSTAMTAIFEELRCKGITDIAAYLDEAPDLPIHSRKIVKVTDANRNAVHLFGVSSADELIGPVDFLFRASPGTANRVITAHFEGRRTYTELMKVLTHDGRLRDIELSVTYPTAPQRLDVTLLSLDDVTDRLRTEAQLRQLQTDYIRAARISTLGELATSIAHEVNQPLSAIVTNAETSLRWLSRADPNLAKVGQLIGRIAESARHASEIVQRIRGMAAPRAPECAPLDLNQVVEEALLFVRHEFDARAIGLSLDLGACLPGILGDRVQLQQVIVNLLVNSIQAMSQNSAPNAGVAIATMVGADGAVRFVIHDGGPGIAPENLDRVFTGFFTTKDEGVGIGLAICQSIIAAHGGTITASNHPNGGALFQFSLPPAAGK